MRYHEENIKKGSLMKKILFILLLLVVPISFLLFHDKGNEYLKPYVSTYLKSKLDNSMSITVEHLKIDFEYLELHILLNELINVKAQGQVLLLSQTLNLDYTVKSDSFKTFNNTVDINGTVLGKFNNLNIKGQGETLKSHIHYDLNIKENIINNIKVGINKADIASLLELTAQPAYAKGKIDVDINIPTLKEIDTKGTVKIVLHETTLNEKVLKKVLKIDLPKKTIVTANIDSKVNGEAFEFEGDIKSNLVSLKLTNTIYNIRKKELSTYYTLIAPKLSKLVFLTQEKLYGTLELKGRLLAKKDIFNIQGNSKSLGGAIDFNYNGHKLDAQLHDIKVTSVLQFFGKKPYATGKLIGRIKLDNIKKLKGNFRLKTLNAKTINNTLKKELAIDFQEALPFSFNTKGDISEGEIKLLYIFDSKIFQYTSSDVTYNLNNNQLTSTYILNVPKLSELSPIVGKKIQGKLALTGTVNYDKKLLITGQTKDLGGEINFKLLSEKLNANINNVSVEKLMYVLNYPQTFKAFIVGQLKYNLITKQGIFTSNLNKAQLLSNELTVLIQQLRGVDLTKERYSETKFNAILNNNLIDIHFKAKSKKVVLEIPSGRIDKATNTINANYNINIENKDIRGRIKGNISKPSITMDSSEFLKDRVISVIQDNIPEETIKDLGLDQIEPNAIKDTVQNILGNFFK